MRKLLGIVIVAFIATLIGCASATPKPSRPTEAELQRQRAEEAAARAQRIAEMKAELEDGKCLPEYAVQEYLREIGEPDFTAKIAKTHPCQEVKIAAIGELSDNKVLADIAISEEDLVVALAAVDQIDSDEELARVVREAKQVYCSKGGNPDKSKGLCDTGYYCYCKTGHTYYEGGVPVPFTAIEKMNDKHELRRLAFDSTLPLSIQRAAIIRVGLINN